MKTMRGMAILSIAATLLVGTAAVAGGSSKAVHHKAKESSAEKQAVALVAWYLIVGNDYTAVGSDLTAVVQASGADTATAVGTACGQLTTDVQSLQGDPPAPVAAVNRPFQTGLTEYATAGSLCQSGVSDDTATLIAQATADITSGNSDFAQATAEIKVIKEKLG
jgi:hypothetical protein